MAENECGCDRVIERAVCRIGRDRGVGGQPLQCVARRRRQQDRRELSGVKPLRPHPHPSALQKRDVEANVVADETRRAIAKSEGFEEGNSLLRRRCVLKLVVPDPRQPDDRRR